MLLRRGRLFNFPAMKLFVYSLIQKNEYVWFSLSSIFQRDPHATNVDYEKEIKLETEKREKQLGVLKYLTDPDEVKAAKPWWQTAPLRKRKKSDKADEWVGFCN